MPWPPRSTSNTPSWTAAISARVWMRGTKLSNTGRGDTGDSSIRASAALSGTAPYRTQSILSAVQGKRNRDLGVVPDRMVGIVTSEASELSLPRLPLRRAHGPSERALIRGAQAGSKADMEELFRRHWPPAYRAAYFVVYDRAAAEDIAQEAFLSAMRALDRFDRRRPFGPWLHRIVVNRAIDWARARALRRESGDAALEAAAAAPAPDNPHARSLAAAL